MSSLVGPLRLVSARILLCRLERTPGQPQRLTTLGLWSSSSPPRPQARRGDPDRPSAQFTKNCPAPTGYPPAPGLQLTPPPPPFENSGGGLLTASRMTFTRQSWKPEVQAASPIPSGSFLPYPSPSQPLAVCLDSPSSLKPPPISPRSPLSGLLSLLPAPPLRSSPSGLLVRRLASGRLESRPA